MNATMMPIQKIICRECGAKVFKTEICTCGAQLIGEDVSKEEELIEALTFNIPMEMLDIIEVWFRDYYDHHGSIPKTHSILMQKFGFGTYEDS